MPQLFVLGGPDVGLSFELKPGALLGRSPDCDLRLRDRSVSRRHARVEYEDGRWYLVDLGSRNGLRVEGKRVERTELSDFCEVVLGELPLRFRSESQPQSLPATAALREAAEVEDEIVLEEEIDLGATRRTRPPAELADRRDAPAELSERDRARVRILRERRSGGLLSGDLAQRPPWVQAVVVLILLALASGLFLLAYRVVGFLRGTS
jgi:hypothetical protein